MVAFKEAVTPAKTTLADENFAHISQNTKDTSWQNFVPDDVQNKKYHDETVLIVVMGVSGSGKSTLGAALAARLAMPFIDADALHPRENIAKMSAGVPLTDADRLPWLQRVREAAVRRTYESHGDTQEEAVGKEGDKKHRDKETNADKEENTMERNHKFRTRGVVVGCSALKRSYRDILRGVAGAADLVLQAQPQSECKDQAPNAYHAPPPALAPASTENASAGIPGPHTANSTPPRTDIHAKTGVNASDTTPSLPPTLNETATAKTPIRTYFVYIHGTRAELLRRMEERQGHFMKASMLDSQLAALEPPLRSARAELEAEAERRGRQDPTSFGSPVSASSAHSSEPACARASVSSEKDGAAARRCVTPAEPKPEEDVVQVCLESSTEDQVRRAIEGLRRLGVRL